jgi:NhaB family Na+:H+ antiporter
MQPNFWPSLWQNFLGHSPTWYKQIIIFFLILNPIILLTSGPILTSWLIILEFIFTLVMSLSCYPLLPGGLIALQTVFLKLTTPDLIYQEVINNISVIFLLIFMVAGIYFMKDLLLACFTVILIKIKNKVVLSVTILLITAVLSAFLDALTVTAVMISSFYGFYAIYHKVASGKKYDYAHDHSNDNLIKKNHRQDLEKFRKFLQSLIMHGAVGTALGGIATIIGEPQNLLIANYTKWNFIEYMYNMATISIPLILTGLLLTIILEKLKLFGYGEPLPINVYNTLIDYSHHVSNNKKPQDKAKIIIQSIMGLLLILALAFHLAEFGLLGITLLVLLTSLNGVTEELQIGNAFKETMPFTSLLVIFFVIISVIHQQHLFQPIINFVLGLELQWQPPMFYIANGLLSMISDNVFVASIYITQVSDALTNNLITKEQFEKLAIAINVGTNIPSIATPNGQAAFLFLLTSALAPLIRLSYWRMVVMAAPYTVALSLLGLALMIF